MRPCAWSARVFRIRERGLEVFSVHDIYDWSAYRKTEIFSDWNVPYRLFDSVAMAVDLGLGRPAASLHFYHERESTPSFGERGLELLRLLLPAYKAGVHTCVRLAGHRATLTHALDSLGEGLLLTSPAGEVLHETPALIRILTAEPEAARLRSEMHRVAQAVGALARSRAKAHPLSLADPAHWEVRTASARYRVHGSALAEGLLAPGGVVLVALERLTPEPLSDEALAERFGLTAREIEVARLMAEGAANAEVTRRLGVSVHTARHHAESVRTKLGVHRRGEVGANLRGE